MKRIFSSLTQRFWVIALASLLGGTLATSCSKDETTPVVDYSAPDDAAIQKYLTDNTITTAQKQPSGLYFIPVTTNANAKKVILGTNVSITYVGKKLDGTVLLQSTAPTSFVLGNSTVISGIQEGVSLMHLGDKAILLLPSGLAYGPNGLSGQGATVPPNTVMRFEIEVVDLNYAATDDALIQKYLADNSITTAQKQPSGLYYVPGTANPSGAQAVAGTTPSVLYTGKLLNGTVFDASSQHGNAPISFVVGRGQVIAGWDEGIALMRKGEKGQLIIPSALAYSASGSGTIAPNTILRFDIEITDVK
ncbi:MAG: FKBP-type peptidyl-prolyl cis-trans isomerase [Janthinobacterium lividum]